MRNKGQTPVQQQFSGPGASELLKTTRERAGQDLQTVAQVLRIRLVYLEAIEGGRFDELPGKTYVVGFVRAYAEYLGLDSEEVVKRFKDEIAGLEGKAELVFPSPVTEQSVPGGAIILIGMIIIGAAYGGWYFLSSQDRSMAELVPDLPAKFAEMVDKVKSNQAEESIAETTPVPVMTEKTAEPIGEADTHEMAAAARAALQEAEKQAPEEVVKPLETVKVEEKKDDGASTVTEEVEKTVEKVEEVVEESTVVAEEKVEEVMATPVVEAVAPKPEPAPEPKPAKPQVMTQKIVLKAVDYSWLQIVNPDGSVKETLVLNNGEEYTTPQTYGYSLRTGNAGGLEIYVDDKKVPSIGGAGDVLNKVLLDPKQLLAGKAVKG